MNIFLNIKVSICILTFNRANILRELLESLVKIKYSPLEIIVVDNNSEDDTESVVREQFPEIDYNRMSANIGVGARNAGIKKATGDIIITLDDDIIGIGDNEITILVHLFEKKHDVGAICFKVVDYFSGKVCNWSHHYKKDEFVNREFLTDEITEGAVAFRKSALNKSGFYPEFFFISHEGPDLLYRLLDSGYKTIYSPNICVKHRTASEGRTNWRRYYYDTRNQIWLVVRNYPVLLGFKYLCRGLTAMLFYSIRDGYFSYWAKGLFDGFMGLTNVIRDRSPFSKQTKRILKDISSNRPSLFYMIKKRAFKREIKL